VDGARAGHVVDQGRGHRGDVLIGGVAAQVVGDLRDQLARCLAQLLEAFGVVRQAAGPEHGHEAGKGRLLQLGVQRVVAVLAPGDAALEDLQAALDLVEAGLDRVAHDRSLSSASSRLLATPMTWISLVISNTRSISAFRP